MAAAAVAPQAIDLKTQNSFPIRLGQSILKPAESVRYSSVRYNHKPRFNPAEEAKYSIKSKADGLKSELVIDASKGEYIYEGRKSGQDDNYMLVSKGSGKNAELVLEKLEASHEFNLKSAPTDADALKLAERYSRLPENADGADMPFGDVDREDAADPSNPFDYRNYLKSEPTRAKVTAVNVNGSAASTPVVQARPASVTRLSRPSKCPDNPLMPQKKRKAPDTSKASSKRVKAGTEPTQPVTAPKDSKASIPRLRVERKATRRFSQDDTGELILENETPTSESLPKRQGAMALALSGQLGAGPISLHSAASSPASRMESPVPERPAGMESGDEFEFGEGESSPEAPAKQAPRRQPTADNVSAEDDEDADADVEDLELPSPVQTHHKSIGLEQEANADPPDDDDDLDKQLALAMAEDDDGDAAPAPPPESEESEEE